MKNIKIISWNIAGARKVNSNAMFDYQLEDISYFADQIKKFDPDIICVQENLLNENRSVVKDLANQLNYDHIFDSSANHLANHIDQMYELGMTIISKESLSHQTTHFYPDPSFDLIWKDGTKAVVHHKFLQTVIQDGITIANTQMLPIRLWGYDYNQNEGALLANEIENILINLTSPIIFCGDFNTNEPENIYPKLYNKYSLKNALPNYETRPGNNSEHNKPDHILYSPEFHPVKSEIVKTQTDHYLCFAEFTYE